MYLLVHRLTVAPKLQSQVIRRPDSIVPLLFSLTSPLQYPHLLFLPTSSPPPLRPFSFSLHPVTLLSHHNLENLKGCTLISFLLFGVLLSAELLSTATQWAVTRQVDISVRKCTLTFSPSKQETVKQSSKQRNIGQRKTKGLQQWSKKRNYAQSCTLKSVKVSHSTRQRCLSRQGN